MYCYSTYGLTIHSEIVLPELIEESSERPADIVIKTGHVAPVPVEFKTSEGHFCEHLPDRVRLHWPHGATFLIQRAREVIVARDSTASERIIRHLLLGPCLGILLHLRNRPTLHCSAVSVNKRGIAFMGWKAAGKSTMAAGLHALGHPLISDDMIAPIARDDCYTVYPAYPQLKLYPDSAEAAFADSELDLPRILPNYNKRIRSTVADHFLSEPVPLAGIYLLNIGPQLSTERVRARETFLHLLQHSYAVRFLGVKSATAGHFRQVMDLTQRVPLYRLTRPASLRSLEDVARFVEADVNNIS